MPIVLVGNKSDLEASRQVPLDLIETTRQERMGGCPYVETSAKYNRNVGKLFLELLEHARQLEEAKNAPPVQDSRGRRLSRRLSSIGSLPSISIIRRKSSTGSTKSAHASPLHAAKIRTEDGQEFAAEQKCVIL